MLSVCRVGFELFFNQQLFSFESGDYPRTERHINDLNVFP